MLSAYNSYREDGEGPATGDEGGEQICFQYVLQKKFVMSNYLWVSLFIIVYNLLIYMLIDPLIEAIGLKNRTRELSVTHVAIFACLIVDMIMIPVALHANVSSEHASRLT